MENRLGERILAKKGYWFTIIDYRGCMDCDIKFDDGTVVKNKEYSKLKNGSVFNPNYPEILGIAFIGQGKYSSKEENKINSAYSKWKSIIMRCYSSKRLKTNPSYSNCTVDPVWFNFQKFAEWFYKNNIDGFELDKDILIKGNKIYSPNTCCFVPHEINKLFIRNEKVRGKYPIGVSKHYNGFQVSCSVQGKRKNSKTFSNSSEAFMFYKSLKEQEIKRLADKYKDQITEDCYTALYNYKVEITD